MSDDMLSHDDGDDDEDHPFHKKVVFLIVIFFKLVVDSNCFSIYFNLYSFGDLLQILVDRQQISNPIQSILIYVVLRPSKMAFMLIKDSRNVCGGLVK